MFDKLLKNYNDNNQFVRKKAEYSIPFIFTMMVVVFVILFFEFFLDVDIVSEIIIGTVSFLAFIFVFVMIYLGKYELGLNLMIILGFARLALIFNYETPFQFYSMAALVLISVNVLYIKKYQIYLTDIGLILSLILQSIRILELYEAEILKIRSFYESILSIFLYISIIFLLRNIRDIIDREISENEELQILAQRDALTNLYNRRKITEYFNSLMDQNKIFNIILFDIDDFKRVNDNYGHTIGDEILIDIAKIMMNDYENTQFSRWGGEEFLIITEDKTDIASNILKKISNHTFSQNINITVSIGQTTVLPDDTILTAVTRADKAMYISKKSGKNMVTVI